jgi:hypothetical protein
MTMKKLILSLCLALISLSAIAQEKPLYEIHAMMLYNFVKYVQWPNEADGGNFVIGVMGEDDVFNTLKGWYDGKPKGPKKYVIKKITDPGEAATCSVLYLGKSKSREFSDIKSAITGKSVLTITDGFNLGQKGSCINFKVVGGKLKFELNQTSVTSANLKVSSQLASMAIVI